MEYVINAMIPEILVMLAIVGAVVALCSYAPRWRSAGLLSAGGSGNYVAEVWLEWPICRGSTLYRQRFESQAKAERYARRAAALLDAILPTHWRSTDYLERPCREKYDYGIYFGVRDIAPSEMQSFSAIWSPQLPGHKGYDGEHASAHPLFGADLELSSEGLDGLKI